MEQTESQSTAISSVASQTSNFEMPPGDHALEVAARAGIGPLSPLGTKVWHGDAKPCVSCGQLVRRDSTECDHCDQDLRAEMIEKMQQHAGPWYVHEHVRPFPGVNLERIIRQIRRGLITATTIVRGPATDHQWRFAVETPGLCRYFGKCWSCHEDVAPTHTHCPHCLSQLTFEQPKPAPALPPGPASEVVQMERDLIQQEAAVHRPAHQLAELSAAVSQAEVPAQEPDWDEPPRIAGVRATWFVLTVLAIVIGVLFVLTQSRSDQIRPTPPPPTSTQSQPQP